MDIKELQIHLAQTIESVAAIEKQLGDVSSSVAAILLALRDLSPENFEPLYAKHYVAAGCEQVRQQSSADERVLLEIAKKLKRSD